MSTPVGGSRERPPLAAWTVPDHPQGLRERPQGLPPDETVPVLGVQLWYPGEEDPRPGAWPAWSDGEKVLVVVCQQLAAPPDSDIRTPLGAELLATAEQLGSEIAAPIDERIRSAGGESPAIDTRFALVGTLGFMATHVRDRNLEELLKNCVANMFRQTHRSCCSTIPTLALVGLAKFLTSFRWGFTDCRTEGWILITLLHPSAESRNTGVRRSLRPRGTPDVAQRKPDAVLGRTPTGTPSSAIGKTGRPGTSG